MRTLVEQAEAVRSREVSPVELVSAALESIETVETATNAFTQVFPDRALDRARQLEPGKADGPLHGVPVAVKELFDLAGARTTGCCAAFDSRVADRDSAVVERLLDAGAIVVAKTNQHEMAIGPTSAISSFGAVRNPWDTTRMPGGSSGGSGAAVACRTVTMAMGSDTGGSVRIPAAFCGVTGLKPTHGAISLRGAMPLVPSLDTAGPLAVTAEDCRLVFDVLAGQDDDDPWSRARSDRHEPVSRIGVLRSFFGSIDPAVGSACEAAVQTLASCGFAVEEVDAPSPEEIWSAMGPIFVSEFAASYPDLADDDRAHDDVRGLLRAGRAVSSGDYVRARTEGLLITRRFEVALRGFDALIAPTVLCAAPRLDDELIDVAGEMVDARHVAARLTIAANVASLPALSFPVGFSPEGLPIGAQLIGAPWSEHRLCEIAREYQSETDWHFRTPKLS